LSAKKPACEGGLKISKLRTGLFAVVADGLDRATLKGFHAESDIVLGLGLLVDEGVTTLVVAAEERRRGLTAEIAIDALLVDVELTGDVLLPFVCFIGHGFGKKPECPPLSSGQADAVHEINPTAFAGSLMLTYPPVPACIWRGVSYVPPGMISDRHYMRDDPGRPSLSLLTWLLAVLTGAFVLENIAVLCLSEAASARLLESLTLSTSSLGKGFVWTLVTHGLIENPKNLLGLIFILLTTFMLGRAIIAEIGGRALVWLFSSAVAVGGLAWLGVNWAHGGQLYGVAAGTSALLVLFACLHPDQPVSIFMIDVGLRAKHLALGLLAIDFIGLLWFEIPGRPSWFALSHAAHLGGMLAGWLYFQCVHRRGGGHWFNRKPAVELPRWFRKARQAATPPPVYQVNIGDAGDLRAEIDRILDKINSQGFQSLTDEEKSRLDHARDHLTRR
jgi:membrane associated rhomboid family serine protease